MSMSWQNVLCVAARIIVYRPIAAAAAPAVAEPKLEPESELERANIVQDQIFYSIYAFK